MERDSIIYKVRRKGQVWAFHIFPSIFLAKIYSWIVLKKRVFLKNPKTFNEKIQWMKINYYPNNPAVIQCTDKYAVREYISKKGLSDLLVPLLGYWRDAENIVWENLPDSFMLKCNHGCAYNIPCADKSTFDTVEAKRRLKQWMKEDFGAYNIELHYSKINPHLIICEEYLGENITDYKIFCFNGEPKYLYISTDLIHDRQAHMGFFNMDGSRMPLKRKDYADIGQVNISPLLENMKQVARKLSADFPFVRVDFFVVGNKYYFAEMTFTPSAGMMHFDPVEYDLEWGKQLDISAIMGGGNLLLSYLEIKSSQMEFGVWSILRPVSRI